MRHQNLLQQMIFLPIIVLLLLLVSGCNTMQELFATPTPIPSITPTPTPTSTPTPTPTPPPVPKAGNWEGEKVSFDVLPNGDIHNFQIVVPLQSGFCHYDIKEIVVDSEEGTFGSFELMSSDVNQITGTFVSNTSIKGTIGLLWVCENQIEPGQTVTIEFCLLNSWNAEWKAP